MDDILFTCAGTSDPVRGNRDGGILHIMRYYHPKRVYLFLSQQIADLEAQDHRFEKTFQHMQEYCAAHGVVYQPELIIHNSGLDDVSKIDLVEEPLLEYFAGLRGDRVRDRFPAQGDGRGQQPHDRHVHAWRRAGRLGAVLYRAAAAQNKQEVTG